MLNPTIKKITLQAIENMNIDLRSLESYIETIGEKERILDCFLELRQVIFQSFMSFR